MLSKGIETRLFEAKDISGIEVRFAGRALCYGIRIDTGGVRSAFVGISADTLTPVNTNSQGISKDEVTWLKKQYHNRMALRDRTAQIAAWANGWEWDGPVHSIVTHEFLSGGLTLEQADEIVWCDSEPEWLPALGPIEDCVICANL